MKKTKTAGRKVKLYFMIEVLVSLLLIAFVLLLIKWV